MADPLTQSTVDTYIADLKKYRVCRIQEYALEGAPDGISGALLLAWAMRESGAKNIIGGLACVMPDARTVRVDTGTPGSIWVEEWDPARQDVGAWQISRRWNGTALKGMLAVLEGTWGPVLPGRTAYEGGCCPQFETQMRFTLMLAHDHMAQAADAGATTVELQVRVALAAHNAGIGGALRGLREGNVDKYTTQGDYSAWVFKTRTKVNHALHSERFKNWLVT